MRHRSRLRAFRCRLGIHRPRGWPLAHPGPQVSPVTLKPISRPCRDCRQPVVVAFELEGMLDMADDAWTRRDEIDLDDHIIGVQRVEDVTIRGVFG